MRILLGTLVAVVAVVALLNMSGGAQTLQQVPAATGKTASPIVAELFTSQSCSSCPPAEKLFADLSDRDDLIVLEWHVDYWDRLVHGRAGAWKDPYSNAAYTKRQRDYNRALRGTGGVYTPQAVINGAREAVGNRRADVEALLMPASHATTQLAFHRDGERIRLDVEDFVSELQRDADIVQLTLLPAQVTDVPRGENRGVTLASKNVVLDAKKVGTYRGRAMSLALTPPANGHSCAILIQEKRRDQIGPIIGAGYCS